MKKLLVLIPLIALVFASCEKDPDTITIIANQGGNLTLKILDETNAPVNSAKVLIASTVGDGAVIYYDSTKNDGICNAGKLLEGHYAYQVTTKRGNIFFEKQGYFQVIGGESKTIDVNPFTNVTKASFNIIEYYNENPIPNINVALIPHSVYYGQNYTFASLISEAYYTGVTNSEGWVTFNKVPYESLTGEYSVMVYFDSDNYYYPSNNNTFYMSQSSPNKFVVRVDL